MRKIPPTPRRRTQLQIPTPGWRKGHRCPQQGKPVSQGHYVVAGVGSNQMLSQSRKGKTAVFASPPPPPSPQRCSEQSDGSQRETLRPQLRPQGHRQGWGALIKGSERSFESGIWTSQSLAVINQPIWQHMRYCPEWEAAGWSELRAVPPFSEPTPSFREHKRPPSPWASFRFQKNFFFPSNSKMIKRTHEGISLWSWRARAFLNQAWKTQRKRSACCTVNTSKLSILLWQKTPQREKTNDKPEKILTINLTKKLYPECIKNSYGSKSKNKRPSPQWKRTKRFGKHFCEQR